MTVEGDGLTTRLAVDGSLNPVRAFVTGQPEGDFYVKSANILIADSGVIKPNLFGSGPALLNGIDIFYDVQSANTTLGTAKTNYDFIRFSSLTPPTGSKIDAFQVSNVNVDNEDAYNPILDLGRFSPYDIGIRIRKNSIDKFGIVINDDITGVSNFNILLEGYLRLINDEGQ